MRKEEDKEGGMEIKRRGKMRDSDGVRAKGVRKRGRQRRREGEREGREKRKE